MRIHTPRRVRESSSQRPLGRQTSATSSPSPKTPTMCQYSKLEMRVKRGLLKAMGTAMFSPTCDPKPCLNILLRLQLRLEERGLVITVTAGSMCRRLWTLKAWQIRRVASPLLKSQIMDTTAASIANGTLSKLLSATCDREPRDGHAEH